MIKSLVDFGRMIKFSHTVFALPFALTAAVLAFKTHSFAWSKLAWIVGAMAGARSAAMGFNRIVDARWDVQNPRTAGREIPRGVISVKAASVFVVLSSLLLVYSAYRLNELCFWLAPVALAVVFLYSYTKRFTSFSHLFLGLALGLAPVGAWIAVAGEWSVTGVFLGLAVLTWVAGFDIIYACQDVEFDSKAGLYSIPKTYGVRTALLISRTMHAIAILILAFLGPLLMLDWLYYAGVGVVGLVLFYEQSLVRADDLSRVNLAFFQLNGIVSVMFFLATAGDVLILT